MGPGWYSNPGNPQDVAFFDGTAFTQPMPLSALTPEQAATVRPYPGTFPPATVAATLPVSKASSYKPAPALNFSPMAPKKDNPGRRFRRKVYIGLAVLVGIVIAINLSAPSAEEKAAKEAANAAAVEQVLVESGYGLTPEQKASGVWEYGGDGIVYRFPTNGEKRGACPSYDSDCAVVVLRANVACPGTLYVKTKEYDRNEVVVGDSIESLSGLAEGERAIIGIPTLARNATQFSVNSIECL